MTPTIIFDLDDTLYPERQFAHGCFRSAAAWAGEAFALDARAVAKLETSMVGYLARDMLGPLFSLALREAVPTATEDDLKRFVRAYGQATPAISLFPDAERFLSSAHGALAVGLITDGHAPTQAKKVGALDLATRFSNVIYTGALGPDRFVYVGDNPAKDFLAPKAMGWTTVRVQRLALRDHELPIHAAARTAPPSQDHAPHHIIESLDDLGRVLAL
jgi:putative hydrolase of the HAD superfamily